MLLPLIFLTFFSLAVSHIPVYEDETLEIANNDLKDGREAKIENARSTAVL